MTSFDTASAFFHACEGLQGWDGCKQYVAENADFVGQCEPLVDVKTVEQYCEWMAGLGGTPLKGCSYNLHNATYDEANNTAIYFATFNGTHTGEGGPVAPTNKSTATHYVYVIEMNDEGKVCKMTKIWNAPWALNELGWL